MTEAWLHCDACDTSQPLTGQHRGCPVCRRAGRRAPLEVRYSGLPRALAPNPNECGVWRWRDWLPPVAARSTLHEGGTPLLPVGPGLWLKNETRNPTWSWKDRPNAVTAAVAKQFGYARLAVISTGNHGGAAAAYAAANGLGCAIFCHPAAPPLHTDLMALFGATVVRGGDQEALLEAALGEGGTFPGTTLCPRPGFTNPFGVEGFKTLAFELVEHLGRVPDRVYVAVGSGDGIYGIWKGFRELHESGAADRTPRMIACQADGADSLARAVRSGAPIRPVAEVRTAALSVAEPITGRHALRAVRESGGGAATVTDAEAVAAVRDLGRRGTAVELASAVALAVALRDDPRDGLSIVVGSGAAVKWPDALGACGAGRVSPG